jgi:dienelactone hydrolase
VRADRVLRFLAGGPARADPRNGRRSDLRRQGDIDAARELVASTDRGELYLYPGDQHYFADSSLPSYDAEATALLSRRVLDFLRRVGD